MAKITQTIFDSVVEKARFWAEGNGFDELLELFLSLSEDEKSTLDFSQMYEKIFDNFENSFIDFESVYLFCDGDRELLNKANEIAKNCHETETIHQYITKNEVNDEEFIALSIKAVKSILPERKDENAALMELKGMAIERGLLDDVVTGIKTSGDVETVVCGALCYEPTLIDEIFGGKSNMYLYLKSNTFTDSDSIKYYLDRLFTMDDGEFKKSLDSKAQVIDAKIKEKKI